tara:strand:+ start:674 stop:871 length:198 start_codon:yes stop_codon:yes gene_type:complete
MGKILAVSLILSLILSVGLIVLKKGNNTDAKEGEELIYQGAIPLGYDLQHFRKTGETIRISDING